MVARETSPRWDRRTQQRLVHGEEAALGELYDRFAAIVHSLAQRVLDDDAAADRITREVFCHVWEHPEEYDPAGGSLRSWVAGLASRRALDLLRAEGGASEERLHAAAIAARADFIVTSMPSSLRAALDLAYHQRRSYRQTAEDLDVTEAEARGRLRLGLQLLASAHTVTAGGTP